MVHSSNRKTIALVVNDLQANFAVVLINDQLQFMQLKNNQEAVNILRYKTIIITYITAKRNQSIATTKLSEVVIL